MLINKMLRIRTTKIPTTTILENIIGIFPKRYKSSMIEIQTRQSELFSLEQKRQRDNVGRIEKIEIRYLGVPSDTTLLMNKGISTPYNCAQHLSEIHCNRSALALVNSKTYWDMHRPLEESCTLQLLNYNVSDPNQVNRAFWRTCSFMLGAALKRCFKPEAELELHSFPSPNVRTGSYVYDVSLKERNWNTTGDVNLHTRELRAISAEMLKLASENLKIERLEVHYDLAYEIFKDNPFKREQLPSISKMGSIILYRIGNHVDISRGPMIAATGQLGKNSICSIHNITPSPNDSPIGFYRIQGVALPIGFLLNHFAFEILVKRARQLNPARLPNEPYEENAIEQALS